MTYCEGVLYGACVEDVAGTKYTVRRVELRVLIININNVQLHSRPGFKPTTVL